MMKYTLTFLALILSLSISAQSFKQGLTNEELKLFKEDLQLKFRLYYESVLNIIDDHADIESQYNSRSVLVDIFSNTTSKVADYLDYNSIQTLPISKYSFELFKLDSRLPLYYKEFKLSDSMYLESTTKSLDQKYHNLNQKERNEKTFQVYEGKIFFVERIIDSSIKKDRFDFGEKEDLKYVAFRIIHNASNEYEVGISSIGFVKRNNIVYDFKKIKSEVLNSSKPWTNEAQEDYLSSIREEAIGKGILLEIHELDTASPVDSLPLSIVGLNVEEDLSLLRPTKLKVWDYLIPGVGHLKFNDETFAILYGGTFLSAVGAGAYYRWNSNKHFDTSREFEQMGNAGQSQLYNSRGNREIKRSNYSFAVAGSVAILNLVQLSIKNKKKNDLLKKATGLSNIEFELGGSQIASLMYKF